ncbi:MAG: type II secretion system protein GspJ [Myxococcota bacterium]
MLQRWDRHGEGRRDSLGFTLVEAVISMAILGLIGILVFGTFSRSLAGRDSAMKITEHTHQIRQALLRMSREIQTAFISEHRDCDDPRTRTIFRGRRQSNGMRLDFTSFSHFKMFADANESDQNELSYFVSEHPDDPQRKALMRREQSRIDEDPDEGGIEQVLAEDVQDIEFEFYNPKEDRWEDDWDTEDADYKGVLPMFVSIKMTTLGLDGKDEVFITKTRIFLQQALFLNGFIRCTE